MGDDVVSREEFNATMRRIDELQAEVARRRKDVADLEADLARRVDERATLTRAAKATFGDSFTLSGRPDVEIVREIMRATAGVNLDDKADDYVMGAWSVWTARGRASA